MSAARIQQLTPRLANQIAAGEVVERPASVVKELLENSLDAGASRIELDIERGGIHLIRISDNGVGIHADDLPLALARHATSKIASLDDLAAVATLGFRGEALASIASVAKLLLVSRQRGAATAWQAFAEGAGMQVQVQPAALSEGTRIEVRELFFNTPARRRFLRSEATEFAHIDDIVRRVALARPDVAITLKHNGRSVRQLRAGRDAGAITARIGAVLGRSFLVTAIPLDQQIDNVRLHGLVGHPAQHRAQADGQYVFVNGRAIRDRVVSHAIRAGFADRIPAGRSPSYALFLELPPTEVDVNVHPTKHEVRFRHARWLHDWLTRAVADAVARAGEQIDTATGEITAALATTIADSRSDYGQATSTYTQTRSAYGQSAPRSSYAPAFSAEIASDRDDVAGLHPSTPTDRYRPFSSVATAMPESDAVGAIRRVTDDVLLEWTTPLRVWRAEAVLAAWLQAQWLNAAAPVSLPLLLPIAVPAAANMSAESRQAFARLGFAIENDQLRAAPAVLRGADWPALCTRLFALMPATEPTSHSGLAHAAAQHLLQQAISQQSAFWQPVLVWAAHAAPQHGKQPTAAEWSLLCQI
ncbi:DNA mismatch repair endonuclease MutL [Permianibacter sp. IMCC34836]|uniref:DNA mismatch repair endonuclease MutL n=1 Tax=Permianibacter fluminis TaxID=2738515 RepID=UPI00155486A8|nr:DNA mismatch repair endonuclease MutL [Permianibacter fluminis]NQD38955.1 DNA mismatch repair endonuclease MutL [Permianibacter fluminis]